MHKISLLYTVIHQTHPPVVSPLYFVQYTCLRLSTPYYIYIWIKYIYVFHPSVYPGTSSFFTLVRSQNYYYAHPLLYNIQFKTMTSKRYYYYYYYYINIRTNIYIYILYTRRRAPSTVSVQMICYTYKIKRILLLWLLYYTFECHPRVFHEITTITTIYTMALLLPVSFVVPSNNSPRLSVSSRVISTLFRIPTDAAFFTWAVFRWVPI